MDYANNRRPKLSENFEKLPTFSEVKGWLDHGNFPQDS